MSAIGHDVVEYQSKILRHAVQSSGRREGSEVDRDPRRPHLRLQLEATHLAEEYAADGGEERMIDRFVKGWVKVMENDRFDLHR
jgi:catalase (peroxidase I)